MKKTLAILLMVVFLGINVCAYELPHAFWKLNDQYSAAVNSGDYWGVIDRGTAILDLIANEPENDQVLQVRASRLEQIAISYEKLGLYPKAAEYFGQYAVYADRLGWYDAAKICRGKVLQYTDDIRLYKETDSMVVSRYARLENEKGVQFGLTSDSPVEQSVNGESMILLYMEFGDTYTDWIEKILKDAQNNGQSVEFAWNVPGQGSQLASIPSQWDYIISILNVLEKYNSVPVYIRFGAEVNIWDTRANPAEYIEAFRTISNLARQYTTNTAMVWSMNTVSSWDIEMNDYYPGDEYVDWVGVSLYMQKYFLGRNDWPENEKFNEVMFFSGRNADPVKMLDEVITKYGDRKPIMIAESGASHYIRPLNEYDTVWAKLYLSKLYNYVPMVYPQVKLIAHFDKVISYETNDYALSTNGEILEHYKNLVSLPHFINKATGNDPVAYAQVYDYTEVTTDDVLCTYVHTYGEENPKVCYYIDGTWVGASTEMPYRFKLSSVSEGNHVLTIAAESNGYVISEKSVNISVKQNISIVIDGRTIESDTSPVISGGRTLVPIRVVANGLGADVQWNGETREVTIVKGADTLVLQIDNSIMTKNGEELALDTAPTILNSRTMVPIRAVSEALEADVQWDGQTRTVIITSK